VPGPRRGDSLVTLPDVRGRARRAGTRAADRRRYLTGAGLVLLLALASLPRAASGDVARPSGAAAVTPPERTAAASPAGGASEDGWHATLGVGTDFPVAVGGRFVLESPFRLRLSTSLGFMPGPYVDAINATIVGLGGYDQQTADLVKSALQSSLVWRTHVGLRAWRGLYVEAGYGLAVLGGAAAGSDLIAAVTGRSFPAAEGVGRPFQLDAMLHMADVEVGYDFHLSRRWQIRAAIGGAFTFAASVHIEPGFLPVSSQLVNQFSRDAEVYLEDVFTSYGFMPVASVSVAYALF
jgi:hypothetical protein